jgi:cell division protein FtsB
MNIWVFLYRFAWSVLAVVVFAALVAAFYPKIRHFNELQDRHGEMEEEVRLKEELIKHLRDKQERLLNDPRFVEKIAREELGLARPGETVFKFSDDPSTNPTPGGRR